VPGLGVDETLSRTEGAGLRTPLVDALGSTLALADGSGTLQTTYAYEPFGATTASGQASGNPSQFTGRDNDGTGLYYYRARYYSPTLQRFISEDPLGFGGGDANLYAYVGDSPTNATDPQGTCGFLIELCASAAIGCFVGGAAAWAQTAEANLSGRKNARDENYIHNSAVGCAQGAVARVVGFAGGISAAKRTA
jgi:RHS repeat-associated protein